MFSVFAADRQKKVRKSESVKREAVEVLCGFLYSF